MDERFVKVVKLQTSMQRFVAFFDKWWVRLIFGLIFFLSGLIFLLVVHYSGLKDVILACDPLVIGGVGGLWCGVTCMVLSVHYIATSLGAFFDHLNSKRSSTAPSEEEQ